MISPRLARIAALLTLKACGQYGLSNINQRQHALQAAWLAELDSGRPRQCIGDREQRRMVRHKGANPALERLRCRLAKLQTDSAQRASQTQLDVMKLALQQFASAQRGSGFFLATDLQCTGRNQPMRINCAMPRASLRSVFTGMSLESVANVKGLRQEGRQGPNPLVSAFAARQRLVLGQVKVAENPTRS